MASTPAPQPLELVRSFVNTYDAEELTDKLDGPDAARAWLAEHELLAAGEKVTPAERRRLVDVREALRSLLLSHSGVELDPSAPATLDAAARRAQLSVGFASDATTHVVPRAAGADGAIGRLLQVVTDAMADGTWQRLKVCLADDCLWAYYDTSRNRSAVWCDMQICGNRQKVRAFRARHTAGASKLVRGRGEHPA
jgi:predicted RNA-binding Zn ribbon-like protein